MFNQLLTGEGTNYALVYITGESKTDAVLFKVNILLR